MRNKMVDALVAYASGLKYDPDDFYNQAGKVYSGPAEAASRHGKVLSSLPEKVTVETPVKLVTDGYNGKRPLYWFVGTTRFAKGTHYGNQSSFRFLDEEEAAMAAEKVLPPEIVSRVKLGGAYPARPKEYVVLSSPLLLEDGTFTRREITPDEARVWVETHRPKNFSGHETVKIVGLAPDKDRRQCNGYDEALVLQPRARLEFGREYSVAEIEEIGVDAVLITRIA